MECRIYYECLEQALLIKKIINNHLKNKLVILKKKLNNKIEIKLVKKKQLFYKNDKFSRKYGKNIAKILFFKNPDIIISVINEKDIEIPLMIIEFSMAVFTKDHELQRADNFLIALISNSIFIKVSPINKITTPHGGDIKYDFIQPFALLYKKFNLLSFHIKWEVNKKFPYILKKNKKFKSFPQRYNSLIELVKMIFDSYIKSPYRWRELLEKKTINSIYFKKWIKKLKNSKIENIENLKSSRTFYNNGEFTLKINRMSHALDPERGMLIYYSLFFRDKCNKIITKFKFSPDTDRWYKGIYKKNEKIISNKIKEIKNRSFKYFTPKELLEFLFYGLSLPGTFNEFLKNIKFLNLEEIDITNYIKKYYKYFNISFRTLITHSDLIEIEDNVKTSIKLTWNLNINDILLNIFEQLPKKSILKFRKILDEDDITFITIHSFFKENKITTLSVSYPGSQSDVALLPEKGTGRQQKRIYIDAIGIKKKTLIFQENKGKFSKEGINSDIEKLKKFKYEKAYINSIEDFKNKYNIKSTKLYLGIGFPSQKVKNILIKVNINEVDYFFVVNPFQLKWKVFSSIENDNKIFKKKEGKFKIIRVYETVK